MAEEGRQYWIWLSHVDGVGPMRFKKLMNAFDDPAEVFRQAQAGRPMPMLDDATAARLRESATAAAIERILRALDEKGIRAVCQCDPEYPEPLLGIYDAPFVLYAHGNVGLLSGKRMISMVGTRQPTRYGEQVATQISRGLGENGVTVVSGLARGIDGICHRGCLEGGGDTIAVLGCGVDIVYPREQQGLYDRIVDRGLILSEYKPGTPPAPGNFPARNRIISGLASGIVVVEAGQRSGTLFTVDFALDQGRDIFAVPGPVNSPTSVTPNNLIKSGCQMATSSDDILQYYGWVRRSADAPGTPRIQPANHEEATVLEILEDGETTFDRIFEMTDFSVPQLAAILSMMEMKGMIVQLPGRVYSL
ncbi:MAG: DNA-processing protein DprA [Christensenellales bacterium]|jgi:DNA processing protein